MTTTTDTMNKPNCCEKCRQNIRERKYNVPRFICSNNACECHKYLCKSTTDIKKCQSDGMQHGKQCKCKNCNQFYFTDAPTPDCKVVEINTVFPVDGWEKMFDKKFPYAVVSFHDDGSSTDRIREIKSFIRTHFIEKKALKEKMEGMKKNIEKDYGYSPSDHKLHIAYENFNHALDAVLALINEEKI